MRRARGSSTAGKTSVLLVGSARGAERSEGPEGRACIPSRVARSLWLVPTIRRMHGQGHPTSTHKAAFLRIYDDFGCGLDGSHEVTDTMTGVLGTRT